MLSFIEVFQRLDAMGLTDVLLPFALIFAVTFAAMSLGKIFEGKKNIQVVIALVIALLVVVPHVTGGYPAGKDVVDIINNAIPTVSLWMIGILMFLVLIGVFGIQIDLLKGSWMGPVIGMICMAIVFFIFGRSAGWFGSSGMPDWLSFLDDPDTVSVLLVILMFVGIVAFITGGDGNAGGLKRGINNVLGEFGKIMGKQ